MFIKLGLDKYNPSSAVGWDSATALNPHFLIFGSSGSGKTTQLINIVSQLRKMPQTRIHVFDCHGDIDLPEEFTSTIRFSETSPFGLNPFTVSADREFGGVRRRVMSFVSMVNRYTGRLGPRQQSALQDLLYDLYVIRGYYRSKPETWTSDGKRPPTVQDLKIFAHTKLKKLVLGDSSEVMAALDKLAKTMASLQKAISKGGQIDERKIEKMQRTAVESFSTYVMNMETGFELDDFLRYDSKDMLKSMLDRLDNIYAMGIFKDVPPQFDKTKPVWRYDIRSLSHAEAGFLVELFLERIFLWAKSNGLSKLHTICCIDEAQNYMSKDKSHIINIIMREGRKFGLALMNASQNFANITDDVVLNTATKLLLGADEAQLKYLSSKLAIDSARIKHIELKRTALVQVKSVRHDQQHYRDILLPPSP